MSTLRVPACLAVACCRYETGSSHVDSHAFWDPHHPFALLFCHVFCIATVLRSLSVTLDNILQDLPEASGTMMEMGGPGPVFDAIACGDAIVLEHCCSILARMAECSPLFAPFICQDGGAHMRTVVRVLGASLLTDTKPLDSLIDIEPADESLLTTLATVTSASALAVATFYEIQGIVALGKLLLAPNAGLQVRVASSSKVLFTPKTRARLLFIDVFCCSCMH